MATYNISTGTVNPDTLEEGDIIECPYNGSYKNLTLPPGEYKLNVWGAQGGTYSNSQGGLGGYSEGIITLKKPTEIYLYSGGKGGGASSTGGYNGGGRSRSYGGSGGGGSDIRIGGTSLYQRVIVAGGGGGGGYSGNPGGTGGGQTGGAGSGSPAGQGGTQTSGGTNNTNGDFGLAKDNTSNGGAGGGGWYGGSSGWSAGNDSAGGGGSGYMLTEGSHRPAGYLLGEEYLLSEASTQGGVQTGHGNIEITILKLGSINMSMRVGGDLKNYSEGWVRVNGSLRKITDIWTLVNGELRKS